MDTDTRNRCFNSNWETDADGLFRFDTIGFHNDLASAGHVDLDAAGSGGKANSVTTRSWRRHVVVLVVEEEVVLRLQVQQVDGAPLAPEGRRSWQEDSEIEVLPRRRKRVAA